MSTPQEMVQLWTAHPKGNPALRGLHKLAVLPDVRVLQPSPARRRAAETLGTWSARLESTAATGKRAVGLASLVEELRCLPPERIVEQIGLQHDAATGIIFFDPLDGRTLGAVLTVRTAQDDTRARKNYELAMGIYQQPESKKPVSERKREPAADRA